ncbi:MAG TPA: DNA-binding response regulator [Cytophagales bacterium]|nr:DNA-binding response regulator [Cytophagales bacterium]HAA17573.1 DNA-binding response regulator [Cytophagales bacterium]HAP63436.1 DNA-binding response regulator [Cytophagales bacterium]
MKPRIALVDDHVLVAKALAGIIERFGEFTVLYEVENGRQLQEKLAEPGNIPDIVLLDINMPEMNGYETAAWLKEHHPEVHILVLSVQEDEEALIKIMRKGAQGYLLKNVNPAELKQALLTILEKGYYYPDWVAHAMAQRVTGNHLDNNTPAMNEREMEFLRLAATDMTYKEIADQMCVSPRTVEGYRDQLFEKLKLKSRVSLVVYGIKKGLISVE